MTPLVCTLGRWIDADRKQTSVLIFCSSYSLSMCPRTSTSIVTGCLRRQTTPLQLRLRHDMCTLSLQR